MFVYVPERIMFNYFLGSFWLEFIAHFLSFGKGPEFLGLVLNGISGFISARIFVQKSMQQEKWKRWEKIAW